MNENGECKINPVDDWQKETGLSVTHESAPDYLQWLEDKYCSLTEQCRDLRSALVNVVCEFREVKAYALNKKTALENADSVMETTKALK